MECRIGCGACCIAPSISSPIPGMPDGKPAGVRCVRLTDDNRCKLFGHPDRPAVCVSLRPHEEMCGSDAGDAMRRLTILERLTVPYGDLHMHALWLRDSEEENGEGGNNGIDEAKQSRAPFVP